MEPFEKNSGAPHSSVSTCDESQQITPWYDWQSEASASEFAAVIAGPDPADIDWVASKLTPQPQGTLTQPIKLNRPDPSVPVLYIACTAGYRGDENVGLNLSLARARERAASDPTVEIVELDAPHNAMVTHPDKLVDLLTDP